MVEVSCPVGFVDWPGEKASEASHDGGWLPTVECFLAILCEDQVAASRDRLGLCFDAWTAYGGSARYAGVSQTSSIGERQL